MSEKHWWTNYPWRMIQTNLREIDMAEIDAETYAQQLADYGATVVTLNAAGIIASYQTKLEFQTQSPYLTGSSLREIIEACHKRGIRVIARTDFSKLREDVFAQHPDWAYRDKDGNVVNYNGNIQTCPNGGYQQEKSLEILREVLTTHPFDGVFCNMSGFLVVDYSGVYHGPCHCENCKRLFREQYGLEIPQKDDPRDPNYKKYAAFKAGCIKAYRERLVRTIREISPELAINGLDYIRTESATEIGVPQWQYSASSNARKTAGPLRTRPADNASVDFMGFRYRDTSVSGPQLTLRQWQNLANAGSVSLYIMGHLGNHKDKTALAASKPAFEFHKKHEEIYAGLTSAAKVLLVNKPIMARSDPENYGWVRALTESHIPFDEVKLAELTPELLLRWNVIILGDMKKLTPVQVSMFDSYVEQGGTLLATGVLPELKCLGIQEVRNCWKDRMSSVFELEESEESVFPRSAAAHFIAPGAVLAEVAFREETETFLHLIPEHPFGPPELCYYTEVSEISGIGVTPYGKGKGICIPWLVGSFYFNEGFDNTLHLMQDVLHDLCGIPEVAPNLHPSVEVVLCQKEDTLLVQLVNGSGVFANSYFEPIPMQNVTLRFPGLAGKQAHTLNGGTVTVQDDGTALKLTLDRLEAYEAIVIS